MYAIVREWRVEEVQPVHKGREIVNEKAQFIAKRLEALMEKKVAKIIDLYKNDNRHYSTAVTLKGRLADIFCVLKK